MAIRVTPLTEAIGAEVDGVDLSQAVEGEVFGQIYQAHLDHGVLLFRGQDITPEQHIAFSGRFGEHEIHVMSQFLLPGYPELLLVSNLKNEKGEAVGIEDAGRYWHSDLSYNEKPSMGSMLYAMEVPPERGDTTFAGMCAAYDALPENRKAELGKLRATHHFGYRWNKESAKWGLRPAMTQAQLDQTPPVVHPMVRTHPETKRKLIFAGGFCSGVVGMSEEEGEAFIEELTAFSTQPEFIYVHKWRVGDLIFWDNRCAMHLASDYDTKYHRHLRRTTLKGERPY